MKLTLKPTLTAAAVLGAVIVGGGVALAVEGRPASPAPVVQPVAVATATHAKTVAKPKAKAAPAQVKPADASASTVVVTPKARVAAPKAKAAEVTEPTTDPTPVPVDSNPAPVSIDPAPAPVQSDQITLGAPVKGSDGVVRAPALPTLTQAPMTSIPNVIVTPINGGDSTASGN